MWRDVLGWWQFVTVQCSPRWLTEAVLGRILFNCLCVFLPFTSILALLLCSCSVYAAHIIASMINDVNDLLNERLTQMPGARWRSKLSWNQVRYASVSFYPYICKFPANILHFCKHKCHIDVSMKPQIFFQKWLDGHLCIVFVKIKCAQTSVPTFACLQKLALGDASPALNCLLHVHRARMGA